MDRRIVTRVLKLTLIFSLLSQVGWAQKCPKAADLSADNITETSAVLSWNGGEEVVTYSVDVKHGPQSSPFSWSSSTNETMIIVESLSPGSNYRFRVMTKCDKGSGGSSKWVDFTTAGDAEQDSTAGPGNGGPGKNGPCPKASNLAILEIDDTSAVLGWLGNEENISYQVDVKQKEHTPTYKLTETVDTTVLYIDGLEPGGNYKFRVKSQCEKNSGGSSSWINFTTTGGDTAFQQCPKPTNLSVPEVTDTSALLTWIARDSVQSFSLDVKSYQGTPSFSLSVTIEEDSFWVEGLVPDGDYHFRVVANCSDTSSSGSSDWSKFRTLASMDSTSTDSTDDGTGPTGGDMEPTDTNTVAQAETLIATFPNPAEESLNIQLPTEELGYLTQIILSDINGRVVYQMKLNGVPKEDRIPIPVSELRNGIYKLMIKSVDFHQTKTILVQH